MEEWQFDHGTGDILGGSLLVVVTADREILDFNEIIMKSCHWQWLLGCWVRGKVLMKEIIMRVLILLLYLVKKTHSEILHLNRSF